MPRSRRSSNRITNSGALPRHALLASVTTHIFGLLDVGASMYDAGVWHDLYERSLSNEVRVFEAEHGVDTERRAYNQRQLVRAQKTRRTVVATHSGLTDLFVPIVAKARVTGVLATGPVALARPTSKDMLERWRALTGRQGHPSDPEFVHYVEVNLGLLTLENSDLANFRRLAECLAALISEDCDADSVYDNEVEKLRLLLAPLRRAEIVWDATRAMLDERTSRSWGSPLRGARLSAMGLPRYPEQVLVGLFVDRHESDDPVSALLRRDAFQRACVAQAYETQGAACGRIGGHGIALLASPRGSTARTRSFLLELSERLVSLAKRRYSLELHLGTAKLPGSLPEQFQSALAAAESALSRRVRVVDGVGAEPATRAAEPFWRDLSLLLARDPGAIVARFERYLESVAARSGHVLDRARARLEGAFEAFASAVQATETIESRALSDIGAVLAKEADDAGTVTELFDAYRKAVRDITEGLLSPRGAVRDRSLRKGEQFVTRHFAEPITLTQVARTCGMTPSHFSRLFHAKHRMTFQNYLMRYRVERARQLLSSTTLKLERVAQLSGLSSRYYLGRVFRQVTGKTPIAYRRRAGG